MKKNNNKNNRKLIGLLPTPVKNTIPKMIPVTLFFKNMHIHREFIDKNISFFSQLPVNIEIQNFIRNIRNYKSSIIDTNTSIYLSILLYSIIYPDINTNYSIFGIYRPIYLNRNTSMHFDNTPNYVYSLLKPIVMEWLAISTLWTQPFNCEAILSGGAAEWFYTLNDTVNITSDFDIKIIEREQNKFKSPDIIFKEWIIYVELLRHILDNSFKHIEHIVNKESSLQYQFSTRVISSDKRFSSSEITINDVFSNIKSSVPLHTYLISLYCHTTDTMNNSQQQFKIMDLLINDTGFSDISEYRFNIKKLPPHDYDKYPATIENTHVNILTYSAITGDMRHILNKYTKSNKGYDYFIQKYTSKSNNINKNNRLIEKLAKIIGIQSLQNMKNFDINKSGITNIDPTLNIDNTILLKFIYHLKSGDLLKKYKNRYVEDQIGFHF